MRTPPTHPPTHLLPDAQDALVLLRAVEVTILTGTGDRDVHAGRVPRTNARNLAQTTVGLAGQAAHTPTGNHTLHTVTLGHTDRVHVLVLGEHLVHSHLLLEQGLAVGDLGSDVTAVDLDLQHVGLLLAQVQQLDLRVGDHADDLAVLLDALQLLLLVLGVLGQLLLQAGEGFLLGLVPAPRPSAGAPTAPNVPTTSKTVHSCPCLDRANQTRGRGRDTHQFL